MRLLEALNQQNTRGLFTYSLVIVDNDHNQSAKAVVSVFEKVATVSTTYCLEPRQSIALARNKAVANSTGDFLVFIDDDELPVNNWLLTLFQACEEDIICGVLGPVLPRFEQGAPEWVIKGGFYKRSTYQTGFVIDWSNGRTNNVILKMRVFAGVTEPFRPQFRSGEDQDFFRRMIEKGYVFKWCNEAVVYELVPPFRWKRSVMLKRALLRGTCTSLHPGAGGFGIAKSIVAVLVYAAALPVALLVGHHRFMTLLIKLCDHLGKLLAFFGFNPIKEPYVTQ
jgi:glycosyltransferase involved in cell wall biosynthesis